MTTKVIDGALGAAAFPATYTGPGTLIGNVRRSASVDEKMNGFFTSTGDAVRILVGFAPRKVRVIDTAGVLVWEWQYGMPAADALKFGATGLAVDTGAAITIEGDLPGTGGNANVLLSAGLVGTGKVIAYEITG